MVGRVELDAVRRGVRAEAGHDRARVVGLPLEQDEVDRPEERVDRVLLARVLDRVGQGVERAVQQ
jgi:hypothetical protein